MSEEQKPPQTELLPREQVVSTFDSAVEGVLVPAILSPENPTGKVGLFSRLGDIQGQERFQNIPRTHLEPLVEQAHRVAGAITAAEQKKQGREGADVRAAGDQSGAVEFCWIDEADGQHPGTIYLGDYVFALTEVADQTQDPVLKMRATEALKKLKNSLQVELGGETIDYNTFENRLVQEAQTIAAQADDLSSKNFTELSPGEQAAVLSRAEKQLSPTYSFKTKPPEVRSSQEKPPAATASPEAVTTERSYLHDILGIKKGEEEAFEALFKQAQEEEGLDTEEIKERLRQIQESLSSQEHQKALLLAKRALSQHGIRVSDEASLEEVQNEVLKSLGLTKDKKSWKDILKLGKKGGDGFTKLLMALFFAFDATAKVGEVAAETPR